MLTSAHGVLIKNGNSHDNENFDRAWCTTAAAAAAATPLAVPSPPAVHPTALFLRFLQLFRRYVKKGVMIKKNRTEDARHPRSIDFCITMQWCTLYA